MMFNQGLLIRIALFGFVLFVLSEVVFNSAKPISDAERERVNQPDVRAEWAERYKKAYDTVSQMEFNDPALRECIKGQLAFWETLLSSGKLSHPNQIESIRCDSKNIADLGGLEQFSQLKSLSLSHNPIANVEVIGKLSELRRLDLSRTKIQTVWQLTQLNKLEELDLSYTDMKDFSSLLSFKSLKKINYSMPSDADCVVVDRFFRDLDKKLKIREPSGCLDHYGQRVPYRRSQSLL